MTNRSKKTGTEHESHVVQWLRVHGWPFACRITQKGRKDEGDVRLADGVPVMLEAKAEKRIDLAGYAKEMEAQCENTGFFQGAVIIKRRGTTDVGKYYVLTTVDRWNDLALRAVEVPAQRPRKRFIRAG